MVDVQNVRGQTSLTSDVLRAVPVSTNFQGLAKLTLGTTAASPLGGGDAGGSKGESVFGFNAIHGSPTGLTTIDGMKTTSAFAVATAHRYIFNTMNAAEIVMETSGGNAQSESAGVNINMVPREGGNTFSGIFKTEFANDSLQTDGNLSGTLEERLGAFGLDQSNVTEKIYDVGIGLGGPIVNDKLWFFAAYRDWGAKELLSGSFRNAIPETLFYERDPSRPGAYDRNQRDFSLRLTLQATEKQKFSFSSGIQDYLWEGAFFQTNPEGHWDFAVFPNNMHVAKWSYTASNRILVEAGTSLRTDRQKNGIPFADSPGSRRSINDPTAGGVYGSRFASGGLVGTTDYGDLGNQWGWQNQAAVSYITGSHALKVGFSAMTGQNELRHIQPIFDEQYNFVNRVPVGLKQGAFPHAQISKLKYMFSPYVQDVWTLNRLTLNLGARFDFLNGYNPAQTRPGGQYVDEVTFAEVTDVPNWKDFSPRLGVAYDLFGDGKTAIKAQLGRYTIYETTGLTTEVNPASRMAATTSRSWGDVNGNFVPDCDLTSPLGNGECGPMDNQLFGTALPTTAFAQDVTEGWGVRPDNWTMSVIVQQELGPRLGLEVGYFRTTYGNQTATDNLFVDRSDFDEFCVPAPTDSRLPGGGGYDLCGIFDIKPENFGQVNNLIVQADDFGGYTETYNGVDISLNARFGDGGLLFGGVSLGSITENTCNAPDAPVQFCENTNGLDGNTQVKFSGAYPLPGGFQISGSYQNLPGIPTAATRFYSNAEIAPFLGRNLSGEAFGRTLTILEPNSLYEDRQNLVDLRLSYIYRVGKVRIQPQFDIYNLTNDGSSAFTLANFEFGAAWPFPLEISTPRIMKFGVQIDY